MVTWFVTRSHRKGQKITQWLWDRALLCALQHTSFCRWLSDRKYNQTSRQFHTSQMNHWIPFILAPKQPFVIANKITIVLRTASPWTNWHTLHNELIAFSLPTAMSPSIWSWDAPGSLSQSTNEEWLRTEAWSSEVGVNGSWRYSRPCKIRALKCSYAHPSDSVKLGSICILSLGYATSDLLICQIKGLVFLPAALKT